HPSIAYHPDIVIHPINHNSLMIAPNVYDYYEEKMGKMGIKLIRGEKYLDCKYPDDIAYNVGRLSNVAVHNFKHTDEKLKFYLQKENLKFVDVKQGYSKCSLAIVGEYSAISSDYPIYSKLTGLGFDVLLIEPRHIDLPGQEYGFIGGTNGNLSREKSIISGSIDKHPNKKEILSFFARNQIELIYLSQNPLLDIGTIITLNSH
ncbi:MAG: DUF6873 family GME fold protein, partial [Tissierellaceae bacterium]